MDEEGSAGFLFAGSGGEREKEKADGHSRLFSPFCLLDGNGDGVGGDAVDGEANFDEAAPTEAEGDFEIDLIEAEEAGLGSGVEQGSGETADGDGGQSTAAEAGGV